MNTSKDILAIARTNMANQRTLMAYVRTSFYFIGLGLTIIGIESFEKLKFAAAPLFILSLFILIVGIILFVNERKKIKKINLYISSSK